MTTFHFRGYRREICGRGPGAARRHHQFILGISKTPVRDKVHKRAESGVGTNPPRFCCKFRCTPTSEQHVREVGGLAVKPSWRPAGDARRGVGSRAFRHSFIRRGQLTSMPSSPGLECPARVLRTTLLRFMPSGAIPPAARRKGSP